MPSGCTKRNSCCIANPFPSPSLCWYKVHTEISSTVKLNSSYIRVRGTPNPWQKDVTVKPQWSCLFPCLPCVFQGRGMGSAESVFHGAVLSVTDNLPSWEEIFSPSLHLLHAFQVTGNFCFAMKNPSRHLPTVYDPSSGSTLGSWGIIETATNVAFQGKWPLSRQLKASERLTSGHLEGIWQDAEKILGYKGNLAVHMNLYLRNEKCLVERGEIDSRKGGWEQREWKMLKTPAFPKRCPFGYN